MRLWPYSCREGPNVTRDPFSEVLVSLGTRSVRGTSLEAGGEWALSFDGSDRLKFVAVKRGQCWLLLPDRAPEFLQEDDIILLADTGYTIASEPGLTAVDGMSLYASPGQNVVRLGDLSETVMVGGGSAFAEGSGWFVLDALPRFLRVDPNSSNAGAIARTLGALYDEASRDAVGGSLVAEKLAEILVIEAVRAYIAEGAPLGTGWIAALADPRLANAMKLLHDDVARRWTVEALAKEVGMSRSSLNSHFSQRVGLPPLAYLTQWRMILAARKLAMGAAVSETAAEVGYLSQSAFTQAFKRTMGRTPRSRQ